jgi:hypothetical protein
MKNERYIPLGTITSTASTKDEWTGQELRYVLQSCARDLIPEERVADCLRLVIPIAEFVEVRKADGSNKAYYKNLALCGSVWHCPICATRISEQRRKELQTALNAWRGGMALITYTFAHNRSMSLLDGIEAISKAYRFGKSGREFQDLKDQFGIVGSVRSMEITYGLAGWHPHIHELMFTRKKLEESQINTIYGRVYARWSNALKISNLWADRQHGIKVTSADSFIAEYVAKFGHEPAIQTWDVSHELTKQVTKKAKTKHGQTPLQLLYSYFDGDNKAGELWREYALTMKGRNQLVWTRGLRQVLGLGQEPSDVEIVEQEPESSILLAQMTRAQWRAVLISRSRGVVLEKANTLSQEEFVAWLDDLIKYYSPD